MIKNVSFSQLTSVLNAQLVGEDISFNTVSIDTRSIQVGELFVALSGERFDGHNYIEQAIEKGAAAVMVERVIENIAVPQLIVENTRIALGQLAAFNRDVFKGVVVGITGSSGKTTVKELIASVFRVVGSVLATQGNLNNEIGVPLTLLKLNSEHQLAVVEMGASALGEIAYSVGLVKPQVVVLTNASEAHVGKFGGLANIIKAKGEVVEGLASDGIAVLNYDDSSFSIWKQSAGQRKVLSFSKENTEADFYASDFSRNSNGCQSFVLQTPSGEAKISLNLLGQHNIVNALAAAAACYGAGIALETIAQGLNNLFSVKGRTNTFLALGGARVIDDTYNASPASVKVAIDLLSEFSGRRILVLGDMGELGDWAERIHREIGEYAKGKVDKFYGVGSMMAFAVEAFGENGRHFNTKEEATEVLSYDDDVNVTILIKGSRGMAMESLVFGLCGSEEGM